MDDKYFSRTACWHRMEDRLVVHDSFSASAPRMITMEPWHDVVFMAADGEHTVDEFVKHMAAQYEGGEPNGLRQQIHLIVSVCPETCFAAEKSGKNQKKLLEE